MTTRLKNFRIYTSNSIKEQEKIFSLYIDLMWNVYVSMLSDFTSSLVMLEFLAPITLGMYMPLG